MLDVSEVFESYGYEPGWRAIKVDSNGDGDGDSVALALR